MDETVYQCPECNFNADNLKELDLHISDNHSKNLSNYENFQNDFMRDTDNFEDDDQIETNNHNYKNDNDNNSNGMNRINGDHGEQDDFCEDDDEDFFNERNQNISNAYLNQLDVNKKNFNENDDDIIQDEEEDFFNENHDSKQQNQVKSINVLHNNINKPGNKNIQVNIPTANRTNIQNYNNKQASNSTNNTILNTSNVINSDNHYERQYTCKNCDFFTNNPRAVLYHRKEFHNEKINVHECLYCQYASQYSGKVERHTLLRHKIQMSNNVSSLNTSKNGGSNLSLNKINENSNNNLIDSPTRIRSSQNTNNLNSSNMPTTIDNIVNSINRFQCDQCPCKYKRSSDLTKHLRLKHGIYRSHAQNSNRNSNNNINSSNFNNNNNDQEDVLEEMNDPEDDFNENSNSNSNQQNNINNNTKSIMANRNFNQIQRKSISEPTTTSSNNSSNNSILECPYCTYTLTNGTNKNVEYLNHVKDHLCGKAFRCVLCNSVYKYRGDCVVHLKRKHQKADMVAHSYVDRFDLDKLDVNQICAFLKPKQHEDLENEEKLFGCAYCDYKANYKGDVFKHQTRRHPSHEKSVLSLAGMNMSNVSRNNCSNINVSKTYMNGNYDYQNNENEENFNDDDDIIDLNDEYDHDNLENMNEFQNDEYDQDIMDEEEDFFNEKSNNNNTNYDYYNDDQDIIEENHNDDIGQNEPDYDNLSQNNLIKNSNGLNKYQCKFCPFIGKNSAKLQLHMATHYNLKQYMCPICNRRANFKWDIQKHIRKIHNNYVADVIVLSEAEARKSISSYIQQNNAISTPNSLNNLLANTNMTNNVNGFSNSPNFKFSNRSNRHAMREKKFKCSLCTRTSKWQWDIKKHMRTVHKNKEGDVIVLNSKEIASMNNSMQANAEKYQNNNLNTSLPSCLNSNNRVISNSLFKNSIVNSKTSGSQHQFQPIQPKSQIQNYSFSSLNNLNQTSIGSDSTGNKKFKCTLCVYRSNWKADLLRHIRKRHLVAEPSIQHIIILPPDVAANTLNEYERLYASNIRKRNLTDLESTSIQYSPMTETNNNQNKRIKTDLSSVASTATTLSTMQSSNYEQNDEQNYNNDTCNDDFIDENYDSNLEDEYNNTVNHNIQANNVNGVDDDDHEDTVERLPVKASELNVKPYKCLKCGFRSDRKSDTLRHIRTKHGIMQPFNFLRILSIQEASRTIQQYEATKTFTRRSTRNSNDFTPPTLSSITTSTTNILSQTNPTSNNNNKINQVINTIRQFNSNSNINNTVSKNNLNSNKVPMTDQFELNGKNMHTSLDYYKCPFCQFKNINKFIMRRHLGIHFNRTTSPRVIPHYKCSHCSFKSLWQHTVKSHVLKSHFGSSNVQVLRIINKKNYINRTKSIKLLNQNNHQKDDDYDNNYEDNPNVFINENSKNVNRNDDQNHQIDNNRMNQTIDDMIFNNNNNSQTNNNDDEKKIESTILTGYDGVKFTATYFVTASSSSTLNNSLNLNSLMNNNSNVFKKKMYYCQTCPYKTNNYCNLKQHLVQHRYHEGYFKCRYCTYYVSMVRLLKQHEILHPEYEPKENFNNSTKKQQQNNYQIPSNNYNMHHLTGANYIKNECD